MKISLEKPGTPEELVHFGVKGMKWGVRRETSTSGTVKTPMSRKKKVAIGVGVSAAVLGTAFVAYKLNASRNQKLSFIKESAELEQGIKNMKKMIENAERLKAANKIDPKRAAAESAWLKKAAAKADWSIDWNKIAKAKNSTEELISQIGVERAQKLYSIRTQIPR